MAVWKLLINPIWKFFLGPIVQFFDHHNTSVTAVATLVIAGLTYTYVEYSKKQWEVTQAQLQALKDSQSAQLAADDFNPSIVPDPSSSDSMMIRGTITVTNVGPTVAREIFQHGGYSSWVSVYLPNPSEQKLTPTPIPNGPSLAPGKSFDIFVDDGVGRWTSIAAGKLFIGFHIAVSYRDIFQRPKIETECFTYSAAAKRFIRGCPVVLKNFIIQMP